MIDGEKIVTLLAECGKIMASGKFSAYDLDCIKNALEIMVNATGKTIVKNNKKLQSGCDHDWVCADNEVVSGASICRKCKEIRATAEL